MQMVHADDAAIYRIMGQTSMEQYWRFRLSTKLLDQSPYRYAHQLQRTIQLRTWSMLKQLSNTAEVKNYTITEYGNLKFP